MGQILAWVTWRGGVAKPCPGWCGFIESYSIENTVPCIEYDLIVPTEFNMLFNSSSLCLIEMPNNAFLDLFSIFFSSVFF